MTEKSTTNRKIWVDYAKGIGILLVIIAHINESKIRTWAYTFHMPLFFFLSGYVFKMYSSWREFIKKKFKTIIMPYFTLGIPMISFIMFYRIIQGEFTIERLVRVVRTFIIQERYLTLWFLACLFFLSILFYIFLKLIVDEKKRCVVVIVLTILGLMYYRLGGDAIPWNIDVCLTALPFFYMGYLYKRFENRISFEFKRRYSFLGMLFLFALLNIICGYLSIDESGMGLEMAKSHYGHPIFTYLSAFSGIISVVIWTKRYRCSSIEYIGRNSMIYFAWHQTIMIPLVELILGALGFSSILKKNMSGELIYELFCVVIIICILTVLNEIIHKLKLQWILGK